MVYLNANGMNLREIVHNAHLRVPGKRIKIEQRNNPNLEIIADYNSFLDLQRVKVKARTFSKNNSLKDFFNTFTDDSYCILEIFQKTKEIVREEDKLTVKSRKWSFLKTMHVSIPQDYVSNLPNIPTNSGFSLKSLSKEELEQTYQAALADGLRSVIYFPNTKIRYEQRDEVIQGEIEKTISIRKKINGRDLTQEHLAPIQEFLRRQEVTISPNSYQVTRF
jgi:hypothetical protein